jgi:hypothetical protein
MGDAEMAQPGCVALAGRRAAFSRSLRAVVSGADVELLLAMASEHARIGVSGDNAAGAPVSKQERD